MSTDLNHVRSMLVVFAMPGCHACHDYLPRFERQVANFKKHGVPMAYYKPGQRIEPGIIPVMLIDATSIDGSVQEFANTHNVENMPTTLLLTNNARPVKLEGAIDDQAIYQLLVAAVNANY